MKSCRSGKTAELLKSTKTTNSNARINLTIEQFQLKPKIILFRLFLSSTLREAELEVRWISLLIDSLCLTYLAPPQRYDTLLCMYTCCFSMHRWGKLKKSIVYILNLVFISSFLSLVFFIAFLTKQFRSFKQGL